MHPSRRPLIAGNWKMNTTLPDAMQLAMTLMLASVEAQERFRERGR